ncbi:MAG: twin-arginine translocation signal domain-containing protein, partial [Gemmatimonadota bacterium]|nr:twin-arginine translocation signal domain-containing protein [Gemmatimonadota bacterium]
MSTAEMDRRRFLKQTAAASLALGLGGGVVAGCSKQGDKLMSNYRVQTDDERKIDLLINEKNKARVMIKRSGAEVVGYRITDTASGRQVPLMWRDSELEPPESGWRGHATVMFPIVGGIRNNTSRLGSKVIRLGGHGFAHSSMFDLVGTDDKTSARIHYRLDPGSQIKNDYPFDFRFDIIYELEGNMLSATFDIGNPGSEPLYCCFGWHPGLRAPIFHGVGKKSDCRLVLPPGGTITRYCVNEHCRLTGETTAVSTDRPLEWTEEELFATMLFGVDDPDLRAITLEDPGSGIDIRVEFPGFSNFGLWSEPGREYICI